MFCRNCGTKLNEIATFCSECGYRTKAPTAVSSFPDNNIAIQAQSTVAPSRTQRNNIGTTNVINISAYQRNILLIGFLTFVLCRFLFLVFQLMPILSGSVLILLELCYTSFLSLFCILSVNTFGTLMKKRLIVVTVLINLLLLLRVWSIFTIWQYDKALDAYSTSADYNNYAEGYNLIVIKYTEILNWQYLACTVLIIAINLAIIVFLGKLKHFFKPDDHYLIHASIFFCLLQIVSEIGSMLSSLYTSNSITPWFFYNFIYLYMAIMILAVAIKFPRIDPRKQV